MKQFVLENISSTWLGEVPQPHVEIKKLISIQPTYSMGKVDYVGTALAATQQALHKIFNKER